MKKRRWQSIIVVAVFSMISALCFTQDLVLAAYPPPEFKNVMVFHFEEDSGNSGTFFYATISGPSPEDVASLTAMGPSGTFSLVPRGTFQQFGLYFGCYHSSVVDNGTYTFTLTDSLGRTTSVQRDFTYAGTLPQVDTATMTPAHQSYVGTITPTLAFSPVSGDYLYQVFIQDLDRTAVWYSSDYKDATSFAVPEGVLQPNMAYQWVVRVWDRNLQNRHDSAPLYFYTGTKTTPEIDIYAVLSFPWGEQQLLNYPYARGLHVAPWDIDYFKATGPDNAVYNLLLRRYYCFYFPMYYANVTTLDPPTTSVPDGTYRFEIKDTLGHVVSVQRDYAFNPIPDFVSDSRMPADNAYFDTDRPTFSWGRVTGDPGDGSYIYSMRITGYFQNMRWYDSPYSSDTTFTPPEPLNLPKGTSYRWRVNVQRANGTGNYRSTSYRTFTLNDRPKDPGPYIQANGSSGPFGVRTGVPVSMQVSLDPGPYAGYNAEWWIATDTPMGWYSYVYPAGWLAGIQRCTAMPLAPIAPTEILNMILPLGGYAFYFALDGIIDGIPEPALVDSAKFIVFDTRVVARFTGTQPHIHGLAYSPTGELALAFYDSPPDQVYQSPDRR